MSAAHPRLERRLLVFAAALLGASAGAGAAVGASRLGLYVPRSSAGSPGDAAKIALHNLEIWALFAAATLLQPRGVPGLSKGFLPLWLSDLTVGLMVALNLIALGGALGALGVDALVRVLPHAPLELGGYLVSVVLYLRARRGALEAREGVRGLLLAGALLACGAFVESYVSGGLG